MRIVVAVLVALGLLVGCGESPNAAGPEGSGRDRSGAVADCSVSVRYEGRTYVERAFTDVEAERAGTAVLASCDDLGEDARGSYFEERAEEIAAWSFAGFDPAEVVGLKVGDTYRVLVLEDRADELAAELQAAGVLPADE